MYDEIFMVGLVLLSYTRCCQIRVFRRVDRMQYQTVYLFSNNNFWQKCNSDNQNIHTSIYTRLHFRALLIYFGTPCFSAFHAAGECRRQVKSLTKFVKNVEIMEFHDHIWNHNEKCIWISTNMPGIGSVNREIAVKISEMRESKHDFAQ